MPPADRWSVAQAFMKEADDEHDPKLSRSEREARKLGWAWLFDQIDKDADSFIDALECEAFRRYKHEHPDWSSRLRGK